MLPLATRAGFARCQGMPTLAGSFLVARPVLEDPSFRRSVVLLLQHGAEGAFGLIVNRQVQAKGLPFPVYRGGPCESPGMFMLHGHSEWRDGEGGGIADGIFGGDAECAQR